jgi:NAD(P)-dependent dehydrogenase (short-subunit alcohol dehydrogenase family)
VTGSTSGIGRAVATELAAHGAHVIVSGRDARRGEDVLADLRAAGGKECARGSGADELSCRPDYPQSKFDTMSHRLVRSVVLLIEAG